MEHPIAGFYLGYGADGNAIPDARLVVRDHRGARRVDSARASTRRAGLALALQRAVRGSNNRMDRAVDAVRRLEELGTPRPAMHHAAELWFAPVLARRLRAAQLAGVGDIVNCCNARNQHLDGARTREPRTLLRSGIDR